MSMTGSFVIDHTLALVCSVSGDEPCLWRASDLPCVCGTGGGGHPSDSHLRTTVLRGRRQIAAIPYKDSME